jgi:thiosulfate reductase cytochrome b subunit
MPQVNHKHRFFTRFFHWGNTLVLSVMVWSGLLIYWANDAYTLRIFGVELFHFFPESWFKALGLQFKLAQGMAWHFVFQWLFMAIGVAYIIYTFASGAWKELFPKNMRVFGEALQVVRHDLGMNVPLPTQGKYNAAQQLAYSGVMGMGILAGLSGWVMYKPERLGWLTAIFGGYDNARLVHFMVLIGLLLFFLVHIGQVIKAGWNNFQSMITGYEVKKTSDIQIATGAHKSEIEGESENELGLTA